MGVPQTHHLERERASMGTNSPMQVLLIPFPRYCRPMLVENDITQGLSECNFFRQVISWLPCNRFPYNLSTTTLFKVDGGA